MTDDEIKRATSKVADLTIQSIMFNMEVDWETLELVPKTKDTKPAWSKRWAEARNAGDLDELIDMVDKE